MPVNEKIEKYSVYVGHTNLYDYGRVIQLQLEFSHPAYLAFPAVQPADWLQFVDGYTNLYLPAEEYADVYHLLQTEAPVFFTAIDLFGIKTGAVHTELDLSAGEPPGEGESDPQGIEALIRRAMAAGTDRAPASGNAAGLGEVPS